MTDITVGTPIPTLEFRIDHHSIAVFSLLTNDPNPIHFDIGSVTSAGLGNRLINQGGLNAGYVMTALCQWTGATNSIRTFKVRFLGNAFDGDTLTAGGTVTAVHTSRLPIEAEVEVWLRSPSGSTLMSGHATVSLPTDT
jgi:acyl dehydratase